MMRECSTHVRRSRVHTLTFTVILAGLATALLLGGCGSTSGGGGALKTPSSATSAPAPVAVATTWTAQDTGSAGEAVLADVGFADVAFVDAKHGWVVGSGMRVSDGYICPTILATSDGGATWEAQDLGAADEGVLNGVTFVDAAHGWAVGSNASSGDIAPVILATKDGGVTWTAQDASSAGAVSLHDVAFVDNEHGWAVGGDSDGTSPVILATSDGGATWGTWDASLAGEAIFYSVDFVDTERGWVVGQCPTGASILATSDGGASWQAQDASNGGSTWVGILNDVAFTDAEHGWAVGGGGTTLFSAPVILATSDGGATWEAQDASSARGTGVFSSVAFVDAQHGWAAQVSASYVEGVNDKDDSPVMIGTSDGGATWEAQDASSAGSGAYGFSAVTFIDATHGWAVGSSLGKGGVTRAFILRGRE